MYVVVAGGGKVGFYLAKALLNEGHEVLIIERDRRKSDQIAEELGSVVLRGDACEATVLAEAGTNRADVIVAVTGDDEDNLVISQMAKKKFGVNRTIARINNPKNQEIFELLGIDATVSSTEIIMAQIEKELPATALVHLIRLRQADLEVVEVQVGAGSRVIGRRVVEVGLPQESRMLMIVRDGQAIIPTGDTVYAARDEVLVITKTANEEAIRALYTGA